jgi:A/G-specific adenine glycosylase
MNISEPLIDWYLQDGRKLPWRETRDPYHIWMSEIILQQTRVEQGMDYYLRFVNTYPTIGLLASASIDEVLKMWQGLGYYSRARNLHAAAKYIQNELGGEFPTSFEMLGKLKGVGPYTAAAIASFAFQLPHAVVDGNVGRVLSRVFDVEEAINGSKGAKEIQALADGCLDENRPDLHNQAIMELGALVCTPHNPKCQACPLHSMCLANARKTVAERPVKIKKAKQKPRFIHYAVLEGADSIVFRKRTEKDIWQGLNDFFSIEGQETLTPLAFESVVDILPGIKIEALPSNFEYACIHQLTHLRIDAKFWRIKIDGEFADNSIYFEVAKADIDSIAVPRLVHKYLEHAKWLP